MSSGTSDNSGDMTMLCSVRICLCRTSFTPRAYQELLKIKDAPKG
jgi:hypothetical protein